MVKNVLFVEREGTIRMELLPIDRLQMHLTLYHPEIKLHRVIMSAAPGYLLYRHKYAWHQLDIRGAGYAEKIGGKPVPKFRLWHELLTVFNSRVDVAKLKHGQPTQIIWQGNVYTLNSRKTHTNDRRQRTCKQP